MIYEIREREEWIRIVEIEADNSLEAMEKLADGDTLSDETEYSNTLDTWIATERKKI